MFVVIGDLITPLHHSLLSSLVSLPYIFVVIGCLIKGFIIICSGFLAIYICRHRRFNCTENQCIALGPGRSFITSSQWRLYHTRVQLRVSLKPLNTILLRCSRWLYTVSHDVRRPLSPLNFSEIIERKSGSLSISGIIFFIVSVTEIRPRQTDTSFK